MLFSCPQIEASADSFPIQLTAAQTLALYGSSIPALYFNGTSTSYVNFEYWRSSKQIVAEIEDAFETSPFISTYTSQNVFGLDYTYWNNASQGQSYPDWFSKSSGTVSEKQDFSQMEFLIYRWQGDPSRISVNTNSFQFNLNQSVTLSGIDRIRSFVGFSVDTVTDLSSRHNVNYNNYHSQIDLYASGSSASFYTGTETKINGSFYFGCAYMPVYFASAFGHNEITGTPTEGSMNNWLAPCPHMVLIPIDSGALSSPVDLEKQVVNIRAAQGVICNQGTSTNPDYTAPYVYIIIACPIVWGDITPPEPEQTTPNYSDQIDNIQSGVGDININLDSTNNRLDTIIQQLDDIYENMGVSVDVDLDLTEEGPLSWLATHIDNLGGTIVNGIKGLFVPTQQDLVEFKLSLEQQKNATFGGMVQADGILSNTVFQRIMRSEPVDYIDMPLLDIPVVDFKLDAETFSNQGFTIIDDDGEDKVRVPLKPDSERWGWFYELLAWAIDIVCTIAVVNMFVNKLNGVIVGKKVVELEDDC